jgi:hypothetical protein
MKWVVSTGVICSAIVACDKSANLTQTAPSKTEGFVSSKTEASASSESGSFESSKIEGFASSKTAGFVSFRIGVQTQLLSVDPFSVNALGEKKAIDLLEPKLIKILNKKSFVSEYGDIVFDGYSLNTPNTSLKIEIKKSFKRVKNSSLWGLQFKDFKYDESKGIVCLSKEACVSKFITLSSLLRSKKYALYKTLKFKKGSELRLGLIKSSTALPKIITFRRVKNVNDGLSFLRQKKIDLFYPHESLLDKKDDLFFVKKEGASLRLSLFMKYQDGLSKPFLKALCASIQTLKRSFKDWRLTKNICDDNRNIRFSSSAQIKAIGDSKNTNKLFDVLYQNKTNDLKIDYRVLKPFSLTKVLKAGDFDFYVSEETYDKSYPVLYEAFHSEGQFNTLKYKNKKLDKTLESSKGVGTLEEFYKQQETIKNVLNAIESVLIRFERDNVDLVYRKQDSNKELLNRVIQYLE